MTVRNYNGSVEQKMSELSLIREAAKEAGIGKFVRLKQVQELGHIDLDSLKGNDKILMIASLVLEESIREVAKKIDKLPPLSRIEQVAGQEIEIEFEPNLDEESLISLRKAIRKFGDARLARGIADVMSKCANVITTGVTGKNIGQTSFYGRISFKGFSANDEQRGNPLKFKVRLPMQTAIVMAKAA